MKLTYKINKKSKTIFVKATGEISVNDLIELEKKIISDPKFERGFNTLVDFTNAKPADDVNFETISMGRDFVVSIQEVKGKCKWAFIAPDATAYGAIRMFVVLSGGLSIESEAFKTEVDAKKWLGLE
jgi:hypothetical protein